MKTLALFAAAAFLVVSYARLEHGVENKSLLLLLNRWRVPDHWLRRHYHVRRIPEEGTNIMRWLNGDKHTATHNVESAAADYPHERVYSVNGAANPNTTAAKSDAQAAAGRSHARVAGVDGTATPHSIAHNSRSTSAPDSAGGEELDRRRRGLTGGAVHSSVGGN